MNINTRQASTIRHSKPLQGAPCFQPSPSSTAPTAPTQVAPAPERIRDEMESGKGRRLASRALDNEQQLVAPMASGQSPLHKGSAPRAGLSKGTDNALADPATSTSKAAADKGDKDEPHNSLNLGVTGDEDGVDVTGTLRVQEGNVSAGLEGNGSTSGGMDLSAFVDFNSPAAQAFIHGDLDSEGHFSGGAEVSYNPSDELGVGASIDIDDQGNVTGGGSVTYQPSDNVSVQGGVQVGEEGVQGNVDAEIVW